jgi:uncharacterized protein with FMN-binding domain
MRPTPIAITLTGAGLLAIGLTGCAPALAAGTSGGSASSPAVPSDATFQDGTYSAVGRYTSPGGPSAVAVTLTIQQGVVRSVKVVPKAENPTAAGYEAQFSSGVGAKVVGRRLTDLNVTTVSGSSLTSQGFDAAVAAIEAKAKAKA